MAKKVRNLDYIRDKDPRLYEALADIIQLHQNLALQTNTNPSGQPLPPPSIDGLTVTGQNGHFHIQIQHRGNFYRGIKYFAEYADNPSFANSHYIHMGDSREHTQFLGNGTYYWRAYASYASSPPSAPAYHGGAASPAPVSGGGSVGSPAFLPSQGSGTGKAGEGLSGPGLVPFRSSTGVPPKRGATPAAPAGGSPGAGAPLAPGPQTGLPQGPIVTGPTGGGGASAVSEPLIAQAEWLTAVTGTNTITATTAIAYQALAPGFLARIAPANTNSGAVTLAVNGTSATAVTKNGSAALTGGELQAGREYLLLYDGTRWQIVGPILPISATVLASDPNGNASIAPLNDTDIWIGNSSNLPVPHPISGDATMADTGALTLASVNSNVGTWGDATHVGQFTVNAKGLITAAANVAINLGGFTGTATVRNSAGTGTSSFTFVNGICTGFTP